MRSSISRISTLVSLLIGITGLPGCFADIGAAPCDDGECVAAQAAELSGLPGASALHADYNCDGFADLVVGSMVQQDDSPIPGSLFVYYGGPAGLSPEPDQVIPPAIKGEGGLSGMSIADAGDLNGDGCHELIVGAPEDIEEGSDGVAYLYLGSRAGLSREPQMMLADPSKSPGAHFGAAVAGLGDINGDGFGDLAISAPYASVNLFRDGQVFVYYGSQRGLRATPSQTLRNPLSVYRSEMGIRLQAAGDLNGDGFADLAVSVSTAEPGPSHVFEGGVLVYLGRQGGFSGVPNQIVTNPEPQPYAQFGAALGGGGDLDGDGRADLVISAPGQDVATLADGLVWVYPGSPDGVKSEAALRIEVVMSNFYTLLGTSLTSGHDLNGDGLADLVIGAPNLDSTEENMGMVLVCYGKRDRLGDIVPQQMVSPVIQRSAFFGHVVSSPGDIDGDGVADLAISAPRHDEGAEDAGMVWVYPGTHDQPLSTPQWSLTNVSRQEGSELGLAMH